MIIYFFYGQQFNMFLQTTLTVSLMLTLITRILYFTHVETLQHASSIFPFVWLDIHNKYMDSIFFDPM